MSAFLRGFFSSGPPSRREAASSCEARCRRFACAPAPAPGDGRAEVMPPKMSARPRLDRRLYVICGSRRPTPYRDEPLGRDERVQLLPAPPFPCDSGVPAQLLTLGLSAFVRATGRLRGFGFDTLPAAVSAMPRLLPLRGAGVSARFCSAFATRSAPAPHAPLLLARSPAPAASLGAAEGGAGVGSSPPTFRNRATMRFSKSPGSASPERALARADASSECRPSGALAAG